MTMTLLSRKKTLDKILKEHNEIQKKIPSIFEKDEDGEFRNKLNKGYDVDDQGILKEKPSHWTDGILPLRGGRKKIADTFFGVDNDKTGERQFSKRKAAFLLVMGGILTTLLIVFSGGAAGAIIIAGGLYVALAATAATRYYDSKKDRRAYKNFQRKKELDELNKSFVKNKDELEQIISENSDKANKLNSEISEIDEGINQKTEEINELDEAIDKIKKDFNDFKLQIEILESESDTDGVSDERKKEISNEIQKLVVKKTANGNLRSKKDSEKEAKGLEIENLNKEKKVKEEGIELALLNKIDYPHFVEKLKSDIKTLKAKGKNRTSDENKELTKKQQQVQRIEQLTKYISDLHKRMAKIIRLNDEHRPVTFTARRAKGAWNVSKGLGRGLLIAITLGKFGRKSRKVAPEGDSAYTQPSLGKEGEAIASKEGTYISSEERIKQKQQQIRREEFERSTNLQNKVDHKINEVKAKDLLENKEYLDALYQIRSDVSDYAADVTKANVNEENPFLQFAAEYNRVERFENDFFKTVHHHENKTQVNTEESYQSKKNSKTYNLKGN